VEEVTQDWRKLHNEELHDLYPQQILFLWSNQGRRASADLWHKQTGENRKCFIRNLEEGDHLKGISLDRRMTL
jgi:hypothetical protein